MEESKTEIGRSAAGILSFAQQGYGSSSSVIGAMLQANANKPNQTLQTTLFQNTRYGKTRLEFLKALNQAINKYPDQSTGFKAWINDNPDAYLGAIFEQAENQQAIAAKNGSGWTGSSEAKRYSEDLAKVIEEYSAKRLLLLSDAELYQFTKSPQQALSSEGQQRTLGSETDRKLEKLTKIKADKKALEAENAKLQLEITQLRAEHTAMKSQSEADKHRIKSLERDIKSKDAHIDKQNETILGTVADTLNQTRAMLDETRAFHESFAIDNDRSFLETPANSAPPRSTHNPSTLGWQHGAKKQQPTASKNNDSIEKIISQVHKYLTVTKAAYSQARFNMIITFARFLNGLPNNTESLELKDFCIQSIKTLSSATATSVSETLSQLLAQAPDIAATAPSYKAFESLKRELAIKAKADDTATASKENLVDPDINKGLANLFGEKGLYNEVLSNYFKTQLKTLTQATSDNASEATNLKI